MNEVFTYDITYLNIGLGEALIHSYQKQAPLKENWESECAVCMFAFFTNHNLNRKERELTMEYSKKFVKTYQLSKLFTESNEFHLFCQTMISLLTVFQEEFVHRKIDYFFKAGTKERQQKISLCVPKESIMHLFGINYYASHERHTIHLYNQPSFALSFYRDFESNKLDFSKCWVESLAKVKDKMSVLKYIKDIKNDNVRVGKYGILRTIPMTNTLSIHRTFLGLGLYHDNPEFSVPRTCLNLKKDNEAQNNTSFRNVYKCSKIIEYERLPNGKWQKIRHDDYTKYLQAEKSLKKKNKKRK